MMGRLFWKIFLWFWCATLLMGVGIAWGVAQYYRHSDDVTLGAFRRELLGARVDTVATVLAHGGVEAARTLLRRHPGRRVLVFVVDENDRELLGRPLPPVLREFHREEAEEEASEAPHEHWPQRKVTGLDGHHYQVSAILSPPPPGHAPGFFRHGGPELTALRIGIALGISALLCFWLAWYLTRPVRNLRQASRALADGDLDTRVGRSMGGRRDEIADLGRDFDHMAQRLQAQVMVQRQLLRDLSHELRSPLARLQVALGLARRHDDDDLAPQLDRIERDLQRMEELIGQMLSLSRLETEGAVEMGRSIDIAELLRQVIEDVRLEANEKGCRLEFQGPERWVLQGNTELLRRTLENVLRNAVRHTATDTTVTIAAQTDQPQPGWLQITICDHGPGVVEDQLQRIFEPFVRISTARERDSGGYGLGLTIASRAVAAHGGRIEARNRPGGGLCISIGLPPRR